MLIRPWIFPQTLSSGMIRFKPQKYTLSHLNFNKKSHKLQKGLIDINLYFINHIY